MSGLYCTHLQSAFQSDLFQTPKFYCNKANVLSKLSHSKLLHEPYVPPWWCPWGFFQTIMRQFIKSCPSFPFEREVLLMKDGGQVALDWLHPQFQSSEKTPLVLILPGLTGSTFESYVLHLVSEVYDLGFRSVVFNNRGNGGIELLTAQTYSASYTKDLQDVINHVHRKFPKAPVIAVGFSLGGMILYNYLASVPEEEVGIVGGMCISSPWNPVVSSDSLERFWPRVVFNQRLASNLCQNVVRYRDMFQEMVPDFDHVMRSQLIREFDERLIVPMFGYRDVSEYYHDAALFYKTSKVAAPLLLLNAADDCFAPVDTIPVEEVEGSRNVGVVITEHGGHIAFMKSLSPNAPGFIEELFVDYAQVLLSSHTDN